jgi:membrane protease YdiL (CAAX protease family)
MRSLLKLIAFCLVTAVALAELYAPFRPLFGPTWLAPAVVHTVLAALVLSMTYRQGMLKLFLEKPPLWAWAPALGILVGVGLLVAGSRLMGGATTSNVAVPWAWILWVPIVEEIVFRVGIGEAFRRISGSAFYGSWFSALTFGLVHADPTLSHVLQGQLGLPLGPFLLGLLCEALFAQSRRILPAVALHAVCNATALLFARGDARWLEWLGFLYS